MVDVPREIVKPLVKEILRQGKIDRDEYPDLWPKKQLIVVNVNWPDDDNDTGKRNKPGEQEGSPGID